ncbi:MAG: hypothetical protein HN390_10125 [Anaerolineae bacterium]|jgi:hypothetical protein|nr:hypothetical protein [Anaerolineae bacterium]MBT7188582.1 hypothetical protein [Anaerolineae bacterium]MBT7989943.1 hypothetical protein [Anaerolineae bacterium]
MQSSYSEKEPIKKLSVWIKWTIVATVCVPLSLMLLELGWDLVHRKLSAEFVVGILGSIALCYLQAIILKKYVNWAWQWTLFSLIGIALWTILFGLIYFVNPNLYMNNAMGGALIGGILGLMQWLVLRKRIKRAALWIISSTIGWSIGLMAAEIPWMELLGLASEMIVLVVLISVVSSGAIVGGITGCGLIWILGDISSRREVLD